jgi:hypothetical protein
MGTREETIEQIRNQFISLTGVLDERSRRQWAATEAEKYGRGGLRWVCEATGMSHNTIERGIREVQERRQLLPGEQTAPVRIRQQGGGRKLLEEKDSKLLPLLRAIVEPGSRGDPMKPLCWTILSTYTIAGELRRQGHPVSPRSVASMLKADDYRLQGNRKTKEGKQHPDRNEQFEYINSQSLKFMRRKQPVVSVDTKKKELVGNFANKGKEWRPKGNPLEVKVHDFMDRELGKAIPYGVYDIQGNEGWVSVGTDHDTAEFAGEALWRWWCRMGRKRYPKAKKILITADGGGSNGSRSRLWKAVLQKLADRTGLVIHVCHFPPGTSKWNKIEHKMFSCITQNWRGRPLISHEVIIQLIANTKTQGGLRILAGLDSAHYETGKKISDAAMEKIALKQASFHGDWNYSISPLH